VRSQARVSVRVLRAAEGESSPDHGHGGKKLCYPNIVNVACSASWACPRSRIGQDWYWAQGVELMIGVPEAFTWRDGWDQQSISCVWSAGRINARGRLIVFLGTVRTL
jgi:hypothetical protein